MKINKTKLFIITVSGASLLALNLGYWHLVVVGIIGFLLYFFGLTASITQILFQKISGPYRWLWGGLTTLFLFSILGTAIYYPYAINALSSIIIIALPLTFFLAKIEPIHIKKFTLEKESPPVIFSLICFLIIEAILFITIIANRTTDVMPSPWQAVELKFFIAYLAATSLLLYFVWRAKNTWLKHSLTISHLFLTYSVAAIIYPLGFGFDGFIHRATEVWIQNNGFITPKQPYYIGQYSLIVWLSNLTAIPIFYLDVYLVPILSALILPGIVSHTLASIWSILRH